MTRLAQQRGLLQAGACDDEPAVQQGTGLVLQCSASPPAIRRKTAGARSQADSRHRHKHRLCRSSRTGFEVHAGVTVRAHDSRGLERLCRYFGRPPIAQDRLSLTDDGRIEYHLKRTWKGGVTSLVFDPLTFIARLVALVPPPGFHLRRYYGVFAPNHPMRARIVPEPPDPEQSGRPVAPKRPKSMAWADLMRRVFVIDVLKCPRPGCGGRLRHIATIHDPDAIDAIIAAVILSGDLDERHVARAPP